LPSGSGQIDTPKVFGHFTRDELIEDCIDDLEVYAIRAHAARQGHRAGAGAEDESHLASTLVLPSPLLNIREDRIVDPMINLDSDAPVFCIFPQTCLP